jgi:hypothetical protein
MFIDIFVARSPISLLSHANSLYLQTYMDAPWASDPSDRRSLSAYHVLLGDSLII